MLSADLEDGSSCRLLDLPTELLLHIIDQITAELLNQSATTTKVSACISLLALRWTCRSFHAITPDPGPHMVALRHALSHRSPGLEVRRLLNIESWPEYSITPPLLLRDPIQIGHVVERPSTLQHASWASTIPPISRHACNLCFALLPSSSFALVQVTGARAKQLPGSMNDRGTSATHVGSKAHLRFCIRCGIQSLQYNDRTPVMRIVQDWEGLGRFATGVVCKRCHKFILTAADSVTALRRKCESCREYRPI